MGGLFSDTFYRYETGGIEALFDANRRRQF